MAPLRLSQLYSSLGHYLQVEVSYGHLIALEMEGTFGALCCQWLGLHPVREDCGSGHSTQEPQSRSGEGRSVASGVPLVYSYPILSQIPKGRSVKGAPRL